MDEASELQRHIHFCGGAEDDGCAAEDGHLAKGGVMEDWRAVEGGWKWKHINRGTILYRLLHKVKKEFFSKSRDRSKQRGRRGKKKNNRKENLSEESESQGQEVGTEKQTGDVISKDKRKSNKVNVSHQVWRKERRKEGRRAGVQAKRGK